MALRNRAATVAAQESEVQVEPEENLPFEGDAQAAAQEAEEETQRIDRAKAAAAEALKDMPEEATVSAEKEVAVAPTSQELSKGIPSHPSTEELFNQAGAALEAAGFGGLDDGFGAYAIIALQNTGQFEDNNDDSFGTSFEGIVLDSKPKWVLSNTRCEKKDEVAVYTYDGITDANSDQPLKPLLAEWAEKGWGFAKRPYTEVTVDLVGGDRSGEVVLLSLPKTSRTKYTGYIKTNARRFRMLPSQYVTRFSVGTMIKGEFDYFPWKFTFVKEITLEA